MGPEIWIAIIGIFTALVSVIGNVVQAIYVKKHEQENALKTSIMENAYKAYEKRNDIALQLHLEKGNPLSIYPWDLHAIFNVKVLKLLEKDKVTKQDVESLLNEIDEITKVYDKHSKKGK